MSAPVGGRLERVSVEVGDPVTAGRTVIARIRPASAAFLDPRARGQAQAGVAAATAALAQARAERQRLSSEAVRSAGELGRLTRLAEQGFVARQALDNARAAANAAHDAVTAADAAIRARQAEVAQAKSALTGPEAAANGAVAATSPPPAWSLSSCSNPSATSPPGRRWWKSARPVDSRPRSSS